MIPGAGPTLDRAKSGADQVGTNQEWGFDPPDRVWSKVLSSITSKLPRYQSRIGVGLTLSRARRGEGQVGNYNGEGFSPCWGTTVASKKNSHLREFLGQPSAIIVAR